MDGLRGCYEGWRERGEREGEGERVRERERERERLLREGV